MKSTAVFCHSCPWNSSKAIEPDRPLLRDLDVETWKKKIGWNRGTWFTRLFGLHKQFICDRATFKKTFDLFFWFMPDKLWLYSKLLLIAESISRNRLTPPPPIPKYYICTPDHTSPHSFIHKYWLCRSLGIPTVKSVEMEDLTTWWLVANNTKMKDFLFFIYLGCS